MNKPFFLHSKCPYCEHQNRHTQEITHSPAHVVVTCDLEEGGCDKPYVLFVELTLNLEVSKIEKVQS